MEQMLFRTSDYEEKRVMNWFMGGNIKFLCLVTREYAMPGDYRHILIKPRNLSHEVLKYEDFRIPLVLSDKDKLEGKELNSPESGYYFIFTGM